MMDAFQATGPSSRRRLFQFQVILFGLFLGVSLGAQDLQEAALAEGGGSSDGRRVFEAYILAYPGRFSGLEQVGGEWTVKLDGRRYAWAGGRLLPLNEGSGLMAAAGGLVTGTAWSPHPFYAYPEELPPLRPLAAAEKARLEEAAAERDRHPPERNPAFFDQLWACPDEEAAWDMQKTLRFFGRDILVHRDLLEELSRVEEEIRAAAARDRAVGAWVEGIGTAGGYLWRRIAGTRSRSYHAYGVALDLVPAKAGSRTWYWLDARAAGLPWYELPYERRIAVPPAVVKAFERQGFVWGGKWRFWDCVHFEYRPEILLLSGQSPLIQAPPAAVRAP